MKAEAGAFLLSHGWLAGQPPEFGNAIIAAATWRHYDAGDTLFSAGSRDGALTGIASGTAGIINANGPPDSPITHVVHPGWWLGFLPLVGSRTIDNTSVAQSPLLVASVGRTAFDRVIASNPVWWRCIAELCLTYGDIASNIAVDLMIRSSSRRCVATLLRLANCRFGPPPFTVTQALVSQTDVASVANLSRNTTNQILAALESDGLIKRNYSRIDLLDVAALRAIVDHDDDEGW